MAGGCKGRGLLLPSENKMDIKISPSWRRETERRADSIRARSGARAARSVGANMQVRRTASPVERPRLVAQVPPPLAIPSLSMDSAGRQLSPEPAVSGTALRPTSEVASSPISHSSSADPPVQKRARTQPDNAKKPDKGSLPLARTASLPLRISPDAKTGEPRYFLRSLGGESNCR